MPWLTILMNNWRLIVAGCLLAGVSFVSWNEGRSSIQAKWDKEKLIQQQEAMAAMTALSETIHTAEVKKDENEIIIDKLTADLRRQRVLLPVCPPTVSQANPSGGGEAITGAGTFSESYQAAFDQFTDGVEAVGRACDQIVEDARVMQADLKARSTGHSPP